MGGEGLSMLNIVPSTIPDIETNERSAGDPVQDIVTLPTVENVAHVEAAAVRDESLLNLQAEHDWADQVVEALHSPDIWSEQVGVEAVEHVEEKVHVLRFGSGDTQSFRDVLLHGPQFRACHDALQKNGHPSEHHSGALLLLRPEQVADVMRALHSEFELRPYNVVITESFEYLLDEILAEMSCRQRPREKAGSRIAISWMHEFADTGSLQEAGSAASDPEEAEDSVDLPWEICDQRTFLCMAPSLRPASSVAQSTTEVTVQESDGHYSHHRGINPRRVVCEAP